MRKKHRLAALQMRVTRQYHLHMSRRRTHQRALQVTHQPTHDRPLIPAIKPGIRRHLVVAAPRRVQLRPRRPNPLSQRRLNIHVHILKTEFPSEPAILDFFLNLP